jgi:DNA-directed RNA polymerase specialized sigma24 family protein
MTRIPTERRRAAVAELRQVDLRELLAAAKRAARVVSYRWGLSRHDEQDLSQDAVVEGLEAAHSYRRALGPFGAYVSRGLVLSLNEKTAGRQRAARQAVPLEDALGVADAAPGADHEIELASLRGAVRSRTAEVAPELLPNLERAEGSDDAWRWVHGVLHRRRGGQLLAALAADRELQALAAQAG